MKKLFLAAFVLLITASLIGCETVKGVGRDIEGASSSVQGALTRSNK